MSVVAAPTWGDSPGWMSTVCNLRKQAAIGVISYLEGKEGCVQSALRSIHLVGGMSSTDGQKILGRMASSVSSCSRTKGNPLSTPHQIEGLDVCKAVAFALLSYCTSRGESGCGVEKVVARAGCSFEIFGGFH